MSTPVTDIYDVFLKYIGKDVMLEMPDEIVEDLLYTYLQGAITEFYECSKNLTLEDGNFTEDLNMEEKFILADEMIQYWLNPKILTQEVIKNRITDGDYSVKSSANLLNNLLKLRDDSSERSRMRRVRYSYKGKNINE